MADDLTIEVSGSADKATSALDSAIKKLQELQETFDKLAPSVTEFAQKMANIASGSKAVKTLKDLSNATTKSEEAVARHNARMVLYNSQMERYAAVSANAKAKQDAATLANWKNEKSLESLLSVTQKVSNAQKVMQTNTTAFSMSPSDFVAKYSHTGQGNNSASSVYPGEDEEPLPAGAPSKTATEIFNERTPASSSVHIDTTQAQSALEKVQEFIDRLNPAISGMSAEAQTQFNALASKLSLVSQRIDNQRALYHQLATAATQAAQASGENSSKYLSLEKRMLAADASMDRLIATQEKLKAQMSSVAGVANETGTAVAAAGSKSEAAGKKAESGWSKALGMFERMGIRIAAFRAFSAISQGITTGVDNMVQADSKANSTMSQLATSVQYLQNSIAAALMPVLEALTPVIVQVADAISWAANQLAIFIAQVTGQKTVTIATKSYVDYAKSLNKAGDSASDANKKVKELQRTIMGFDELNVLQKNVDAVGGGKVNTPDYDSMFKTIKTPASNFDFSDLQKNAQKAFDKLKDAADKGGKALDKVTDKAKELQNELGKVPSRVPVAVDLKMPDWGKVLDELKGKLKVPVVGEWKAPKIPIPQVKVPVVGEWKIPEAPEIPTLKVPAWDFGAYDQSKQKYEQPIPAPTITAGVVPALILTSLESSLLTAQAKIKSFSDSSQQTINAWKTNVSNNASLLWTYVSTVTVTSLAGVNLKINQWKGSASKAFADAGTNIMKNMRYVFVFIPEAVGEGLNEAGKRASSWLTSTGKGFASWGENLVSNIGKTMSAWYSSFVGALSSAWSQFTSFMSATGKKISGVWNANKGWIIPTVIGIGVGAYAISVIATGGATLAAAPALAALANGALVTAPTEALIGEGADSEAVLPLNQNVFSQIAQGIIKNGQSDNSGSALNTERIIKRMDDMQDALEHLKIYIYGDDKKIAESANHGNRLLGKTAPTN